MLMATNSSDVVVNILLYLSLYLILLWLDYC